MTGQHQHVPYLFVYIFHTVVFTLITRVLTLKTLDKIIFTHLKHSLEIVSGYRDPQLMYLF